MKGLSYVVVATKSNGEEVTSPAMTKKQAEQLSAWMKSNSSVVKCKIIMLSKAKGK